MRKLNEAVITLLVTNAVSLVSTVVLGWWSYRLQRDKQSGKDAAQTARDAAKMRHAEDSARDKEFSRVIDAWKEIAEAHRAEIERMQSKMVELMEEAAVLRAEISSLEGSNDDA